MENKDYKNYKDFKQLLHAGQKCCNGGRWKTAVQMFELYILQYTAENAEKLRNHTFIPYGTYNFDINERGKTRHIRSHIIQDREIYKSFCLNELIPKTEHKILPNNSASQAGKGTDHAINVFKQALVKAYKKYGRNFYVWTYDFSDYFNSIPQQLAIIDMGLEDLESKELLQEYAKLFDTGFGIGGEPSQRIAVVYPSTIDGFIASYPGIDASGRYMDDGWAISSSKKILQQLNRDFVNKAVEKGLVVNRKHTDIYNMNSDTVTFLKKRTHINNTGKVIMQLTRKNVYDEIRRIKKHKQLYDKGVMPSFAIIQSLQCWYNYADKYNSHTQAQRVLKFWAKIFNVPIKDANKIVKGGNYGYKLS